MSGALLGALVGLPFGILASALAWWIVFHGLRPRLQWVEAIEAVPREGVPQPTEHAVAFRNTGRRAAVEVHTHARLRIKGLMPARPKRWIVIEIPTNNTVIPRVDTFRSSGRTHILVLLPTAAREADLQRLPGNLAHEVRSGSIGLPGLMSLGTAADVTLSAICSDEFSGARHAFLSPRLTRQHLTEDEETLDG